MFELQLKTIEQGCPFQATNAPKQFHVCCSTSFENWSKLAQTTYTNRFTKLISSFHYRNLNTTANPISQTTYFSTSSIVTLSNPFLINSTLLSTPLLSSSTSSFTPSSFTPSSNLESLQISILTSESK